MIEPRLTTQFQISALIRAANEFGDDAMVIRKGDNTSGEIFISTLIRGENPRFFGKMPSFDGPSSWEERIIKDIENKEIFDTYINKLLHRDPDLWLIELNVSNEQRLIRILDLEY